MTEDRKSQSYNSFNKKPGSTNLRQEDVDKNAKSKRNDKEDSVLDNTAVGDNYLSVAYDHFT